MRARLRTAYVGYIWGLPILRGRGEKWWCVWKGSIFPLDPEDRVDTDRGDGPRIMKGETRIRERPRGLRPSEMAWQGPGRRGTLREVI